jgi:hypothetical protein
MKILDRRYAEGPAEGSAEPEGAEEGAGELEGDEEGAGELMGADGDPGELVGALVGALVVLVGVGHFFLIFTQAVVPHSFSPGQQKPGLAHSLLGQRFPPVHWASFVQFPLIVAASSLPKGRQRYTTNLDAQRRAASPVLPAQNLTQRFVQTCRGFFFRYLPASSPAPVRGDSSASRRSI